MFIVRIKVNEVKYLGDSPKDSQVFSMIWDDNASRLSFVTMVKELAKDRGQEPGQVLADCLKDGVRLGYHMLMEKRTYESRARRNRNRANEELLDAEGD